ncbi:MAG TPA: YbaB/EbfC family nucleoid-associated protein [Firmicutes bacterium]|jgi:DNA-binding protein YbaB|nr:YbaB/EbfC family nucleoid-associated protein [Bacillota bacterium]
MGGFNPADFLGQMSRLQDELLRKRAALQEKTVTASLADGQVRVTVNGHQQVTDVQISDKLWQATPQQVGVLIQAAVNQAMVEALQMAKDDLASMFGDIELPDVPGLFGSGS